MHMSTAKEEALTLINELSDDASWEEIQYHIYVKQKIDRGLADIDAGRVSTHEDIVARMSKWTDS
jgi:predicted transcriptional regulator